MKKFLKVMAVVSTTAVLFGCDLGSGLNSGTKSEGKITTIEGANQSPVFCFVQNNIATKDFGEKNSTFTFVDSLPYITITNDNSTGILTFENSSPSSSDVWATYAFNEPVDYKANTNYKFSVDLKSNKETIVQLGTSFSNCYETYDKLMKVGTEWQTYTFNTEKWTEDTKVKLSIAMGRSEELEIRNVKMEETTETGYSIKADYWVNGDLMKDMYEYAENSITVNNPDDAATNAYWHHIFIGSAAVNKYNKVSFDISSTKATTAQLYIHSLSGSENISGGTNYSIPTSKRNVTVYFTCSGESDDILRQVVMDFVVNDPCKITIENVKIETVDGLPSTKQLCLCNFNCEDTQDWSNYWNDFDEDNTIVFCMNPGKTKVTVWAIEDYENSWYEGIIDFRAGVVNNDKAELTITPYTDANKIVVNNTTSEDVYVKISITSDFKIQFDKSESQN